MAKLDKYEATEIVSRHVNSSSFNNALIMRYIESMDYWYGMTAEEFEAEIIKDLEWVIIQLNDC